MSEILATAIVAALSAGSGAYFGAYLRKKAEARAVTEDLENIINQLQRTTAAQEEIKAQISGSLWREQARLTSIEAHYKRLLGECGMLTSALLQVAAAEHFRPTVTDPKNARLLNTMQREFERVATRAFKRLVRSETIARVWVGAEAGAALDRFADSWQKSFGSPNSILAQRAAAATLRDELQRSARVDLGL